MHGDGTKPRGTLPEQVLLDVSRTLYRTHPPTGIDKVEAAYRAHFGGYRVARIGRKLALLNRCPEIASLDLLGQAQPWRPRQIRAIESAIRAQASWRGRPSNLRHAGIYVNVGHSNLERLSEIKTPKIVMVHDTIPLDHPNWQRPKSVSRFKKSMMAVSAHATVVITPSAVTADRVRWWLSSFGRCPKIHVAPLGIPKSKAQPHIRARPYFVAVGTLEPRKNIGFLLQLWESLGPNAPDLVLIGRRGWESESFFDGLDTACATGRVIELGSISDDAVAAHLAGSQGLLFPSLAEGFGLPVLEAVAAGKPVLANDLPIIREIAPEAICLPVGDALAWKTKILELAKSKPNSIKSREIPGWEAHFEMVDAIISDVLADA